MGFAAFRCKIKLFGFWSDDSMTIKLINNKNICFNASLILKHDLGEDMNITFQTHIFNFSEYEQESTFNFIWDNWMISVQFIIRKRLYYYVV